MKVISFVLVAAATVAGVLGSTNCAALADDHPSSTAANDSAEFDASPMVYAKSRAPIMVEINGETQPYSAEYAVAAEFGKKGGNVVFCYPTIVFEPRKPGVACVLSGNFEPSLEEEFRNYLEGDPRLRVVHRVQYDQKEDSLRVLFKVQFYPDQFKSCVHEAIKTNVSDQDRTAGANYSLKPVTFFEEAYAPQLEFHLNTGLEDRVVADLFESDPDYLAYRVFPRGQNYLGTQDVWVTFRSLADSDETRSPIVAFRLFCENSEYVRARLTYCYKAKTTGEGTAATTIDFSEAENVVKKLETENSDREGEPPIVDRRTRND